MLFEVDETILGSDGFAPARALGRAIGYSRRLTSEVGQQATLVQR